MNSGKLKIGFVLDDRLDKPDGVQQYVKLVAKWMSSQGHEVRFLVGHSPNTEESGVYHLSRTVGVRFNKNRMAIPLPASLREIKAILKSEKFDVLHVQMPYSPLLAAKVIRAAGSNTAVVGTFHILPHGKLSQIGTKALSIVLRKNKRRFDAVASVSSAAKDFAQSHYGITSEVIPNAVDLSSYAKAVPRHTLKSRKNIVFLGRFVPRKGAAHALAAYRQLVRNHPEYAQTTRLIMCGDGPERSSLEMQATELQKQYHAEVLFTGFASEYDKPSYLASADIAVFPSTGGESFGIVLIEAMAARAGVVLGGNNPGYATVLRDERMRVEPDNHQEFATVMHTILSAKSYAHELHEKQAELVRRYDIQTVGPQILALYRTALAKRL